MDLNVMSQIYCFLRRKGTFFWNIICATTQTLLHEHSCSASEQCKQLEVATQKDGKVAKKTCSFVSCCICLQSGTNVNRANYLARLVPFILIMWDPIQPDKLQSVWPFHFSQLKTFNQDNQV